MSRERRLIFSASSPPLTGLLVPRPQEPDLTQESTGGGGRRCASFHQQRNEDLPKHFSSALGAHEHFVTSSKGLHGSEWETPVPLLFGFLISPVLFFFPSQRGTSCGGNDNTRGEKQRIHNTSSHLCSRCSLENFTPPPSINTPAAVTFALPCSASLLNPHFYLFNLRGCKH